MIDLFRKTVLMGIGAASLTAEQVKSFVGDLEKQGRLSREEAEKLAREVAQKTSDHVKTLAAELEEEGRLTKDEIERFARDMALKTSENIKVFVEDMKNKGRITREEAENLTEEAVSRTEQARKELEERVCTFVAELQKKFNMVSRADFDALAARVEKLEEELSRCGKTDETSAV